MAASGCGGGGADDGNGFGKSLIFEDWWPFSKPSQNHHDLDLLKMEHPSGRLAASQRFEGGEGGCDFLGQIPVPPPKRAQTSGEGISLMAYPSPEVWHLELVCLAFYPGNFPRSYPVC